MAKPLEPVTLQGTYVRLEPLGEQHIDGLTAVGLDPDLWQLGLSMIQSRDDMAQYVNTALAEHARGVSLPFATIEQATNTVVGSTRFGNIDLAHRRVEIGWTWIARAWQRSAVNTEAKLLMLSYAFETLGCQRVELKTDVLNQRSRTAILRLGAIEEGILRKHMITASGRVRDTVYFSIVDDEWATVKANLQEKLAHHAHS